MGSISLFPGKAAAVFLLLTAAFLYGEQPTAGSEIQNLEKILGKSPAGAEKHDALVHLARLYELLGNLEAAAETWLKAASAEPGKRDDASLVKSGRCFAAMGEWEKAETAIRPALLSSRGANLEARYLGAQIEAFRSGDVSALQGLLEDPGFSGLKAAIYYTLWRITGAETWKAPLLSEYSRSPEGRIAGAFSAGGAVGARPSALWLLMPGGVSPEARPAGVRNPVSAVPPAAPPPAAAAPASPRSRDAALQTGLFGREANARIMTGKLEAAGFSSVVVRRSVNGNDYWAVQVPSGGDVNGTILRLKNAGFESFPVY
ncbi:MAG: SPOR domain-containing protein [Treponema sp.]|nr:SPOR domain-containing protein [Treponema sp.]